VTGVRDSQRAFPLIGAAFIAASGRLVGLRTGGTAPQPARRHAIALDELSPAEAAALGPVLQAVTSALREVTGDVKTYVALFAEAEGFGQVHFHVVPRHADLDPQLRGPRIFALMGGDPARHVPDDEMDSLAGQLTAALSRVL
jgi:diadenosine tetraphosphate (Ap4A) HIT family hydrolase